MDIINNYYINGLVVLFLFITSTFLGLSAFIRNRKSQANLIFTRFAIATAFWILFAFLTDLPSMRSVSMILAKFLYLALITLSYSLFTLTFEFPKKRSLNPVIKYFFTIWGAILIILTFVTDLIIKELTYSPWVTNVIDGNLAPLFYIFMLIGAFSSLQYIFIYKKLSVREKLQVKLFVIGLSIFMLTNIFVQSIIKPLITHTDEFYKIGTYSSIFMITFTGYAIIKHRFMDISLLVARTVSYTLLVGLFGLLYAVSFAILSSIFISSAMEIRAVVVSTILALFMAFTFQPLKRILEKLTDKIFYKDHYNANTLLYNLTYIMASTLRLENLTHQLLQQLLKEMRISKGAFILTQKNKIYEVAHEGYASPPELDEQKITTLLEQNKMLIFEELPEGDIKNIMRDLDFSLSAYLSAEGEKLGLLVFGPKLSGDIYTEEDIKVIEIFSSSVAVAIQNAKSYEEIKRFNITLEEEVDQATADLQNANDKLKQLDKLKSEFVSLASHELRTPMTIIKSYLWFLIEGKIGPENAKQRDYLEKAYSSTERLIKLVNDMLNVSRIESGKITLDKKNISMNQLADETVNEMLTKAQELGVKLSLVNDSKDKFELEADRDKIKEVLINLIGNSFKFTPKDGSINVLLSKLSDGMVQIAVKDTGKGISKDDIPKLFHKFGMVGGDYRTKLNTQGTGLGLYISKSIIEMHGGKMWADSDGINKGTTFFFTLPPIGTKQEIIKDEEKVEVNVTN